MKDFAESVCESPIHSDVEAKLRTLLIELGETDKILGIQVCAYKDGKVIIDTAAGVLGKDDSRPVQHDTLFPVFSTTKGVTAGMIHWLADKGKLKFDEPVANFWPEFGTNGKEKIKVHHVLNHTSGLHNALAGISDDILCDWEECLKRIEMATPETEPGCEQLYHYQSYGWLCGGIIEHASGKKFQEVLEEAFVRPLHVEGELYIGIPPGVEESRLANITLDTTEFNTYLASYSETGQSSSLRMPKGPSTLTPDMLIGFVDFTNSLNGRRAILPAGNGNFSARALARYYAALVDGGTVPPYSSSTLPPLGSHPHHPTLQKDEPTTSTNDKIFSTPKSKLHDAFLGRGDYKDLILPGGRFGIGFGKIKAADGFMIGFGHPGLGGSAGYCDINNRFSIAVTLNKLSFGDLTGKIVRLICSELDLPVPEEYVEPPDSIETPVFN